jgi:hypothetical protein
VGVLCADLAPLAAAPRFFAETGSRFRGELVLAGAFAAGAAASAWDADATLDLAALSMSFTPLVPASYSSMTVPSNASTRCKRLMAFFAFMYCSWFTL